MTPSGTLNLKNNTYVLYYSDLRNICVKVWFPLCTSSIPLEGVLPEFEAYLLVTKSLIRSLLLDLPDIILHISRIWLHCITTQAVVEIDICPFLSPPSIAMTARGFLLPIQMQTRDKSVHIMPGSLFCKQKPLPLLFDKSHTKTISLYSQVPDLQTCHIKTPPSSEQLCNTPP